MSARKPLAFYSFDNKKAKIMTVPVFFEIKEFADCRCDSECNEESVRLFYNEFKGYFTTFSITMANR